MVKRKHSKSVGTILRESREAREQDLGFVSAALRIRENHLHAIEEGHMDRLPAPAYAAGFIRTYATYLGLDEDDMIALFREETGQDNHVALDFPVMDDTRELPSMTLIAGLLIIVGIIYLFWIFLSDAQNTVRDRAGIDSQASHSETGTTGAPVDKTNNNAKDKASANPPLDAASRQVETRALAPAQPIIKIHAKGETWMRVENEKGRVLFSSIIRGGEDFTLPQGAYFILATGNAGQLEYWVDNEPVSDIGVNGQRLDGRKIFPKRIITDAIDKITNR